MFNSKTVSNRLEQLGYEVTNADNASVLYAIEKVAERIKNETNQKEIPEGLFTTANEMACGEFFQIKRTFAPDSLTGFDLESAVKQIQIGDTSTSFDFSACQSDDQKLSSFINNLLNTGKGQFSKYRRLCW